MDILVASFNEHKLLELKPLFPGLRLVSPTELGYGELEIEEDGQSYFENALIKAKALYERAGIPTLADDSGLSVDALDGAPGIRSSRYGAPDGNRKLSSPERNALLLSEMEGVADRNCAFYCCLVFMYGKDRFASVQETCPGLLLESPRGMGGFGYDPIVYLPELGKSVAELSSGEKSIVSHRGRAARRMNVILQGTDFSH